VQRAPGIPHALEGGGRFLHNSGASCREIANVRLGFEGALRFHVIASAAKQSILSLRGKMDCFATLAMTVTTQTHPSCPDLIRASINLRKMFSRRRWITGSSPVMTIAN
jgi:hypothetical protein